MGCATPFPELRVTRNTVQSETRPRPVRFRGRSYLAFSLAPEPPIADWLADLDAAIDRSSGFFVGRPAVLDLGNTALSQSAIALLIQELEARHIRIMGIGREGRNLGPDHRRRQRAVVASGGTGAQWAQDKPAPKPAEQRSVLGGYAGALGRPSQFGGDVVVIGSVAWGAEVVTSSSVTSTGCCADAPWPATGNTKAAFCRSWRPSSNHRRLLPDVDDIESDLRNRPVQAWLDGNAMLIAALD
jgi:septum site-determining protein MinC